MIGPARNCASSPGVVSMMIRMLLFLLVLVLTCRTSSSTSSTSTSTSTSSSSTTTTSISSHSSRSSSSVRRDRRNLQQPADGGAATSDGTTTTYTFTTPDGYPVFGEDDIVMELPSGGGNQGIDSLRTIVVNDKSKGTTWALHVPSRQVIAIELPFSGGNHETAVLWGDNKDPTQSPTEGAGAWMAVPHYETAESDGVTEGGGTPGSEVSIVDLNTGAIAEVLDPFLSDGVTKPKPHGAVWMKPQSTSIDRYALVSTGQVLNELTVWKTNTTTVTTDSSFSKRSTSSTKTVEIPRPCSTPHLVYQVPANATSGRSPDLVETGCRCTNAGDNDTDCRSSVALTDVATGESVVLPAPAGAEGLTVTKSGDVWVGGARSSEIAIYGRNRTADPLSLDNFALLETKTDVSKPLRLAYDERTDRVAVVPLVSTDSNVLSSLEGTEEPNLFIYDASGSRDLLRTAVLTSDRRGRINSEGLASTGTGYSITGGFDTATMVVVDALTADIAATFYMPHCTLPRDELERLASPSSSSSGALTFLPVINDTVDAQLNITGANNWSGGYCPKTERNPYDNRFTVLDGFNYVPDDGRCAERYYDDDNNERRRPCASYDRVGSTTVGITILCSAASHLRNMHSLENGIGIKSSM